MESIGICMVRESLAAIPRYPLPCGYSMRLYRPGDSTVWVKLWQTSENTFHGQFGHNLRRLERRCLFLIAPNGEEVGTITAWYCRYRGRRWGMLHWVAISPEHRGKGLSRPLVAKAMDRLRSLGHRRAMLTTDTGRIRAIKTYLRFGFVPDVAQDSDTHAWRLVRAHVSHPALGSV